MGNIFAGSEVVQIGIQIEINGKDFYDTLMKSTKNDKARDIYKFLSQEEERHIAAFKKILDQTEKYEPQGLDSADYYSYMNALASEHIFTQKDKGVEAATKVKSDKEAIDIALGFEKDSIIFYEGMKKVIPEYDIKILDELIAQEQNHVRILTDIKKNI